MRREPERGGVAIAISSAPWIIAFTVAHYALSERYNLAPDEQALRVMASLAIKVESPE